VLFLLTINVSVRILLTCDWLRIRDGSLIYKLMEHVLCLKSLLNVFLTYPLGALAC